MKTVNLQEARNDLPRLVEDAANGEPFVIAEGGKPLVKVVAVDDEATKKIRRIGFLKGRISVPDDFDTMMSREIEEMFYGVENPT